MAARVLLKATRSLQRISVSQCLQKRAPVLNVAHRQFSVSSAVNGEFYTTILLFGSSLSCTNSTQSLGKDFVGVTLSLTLESSLTLSLSD